MSVKDNRVDVRYHMNTGKAAFVVKKSAKADEVKIRRSFWWCSLVHMTKFKYDFTKDVWAVDYKAKYRMEC